WINQTHSHEAIIMAQTATNVKSSHTLQAARAYVGAGISVVPIKRDGSKLPLIEWGVLQERLPAEEELTRWFDRSDPAGIATVGGLVSGGLELIDFDKQAATVYPEWRDLVEDECPGLMDRLSVVRTPREPAGGYHVRYRCTEVTVCGNMKLATEVVGPKK